VIFADNVNESVHVDVIMEMDCIEKATIERETSNEISCEFEDPVPSHILDKSWRSNGWNMDCFWLL